MSRVTVDDVRRVCASLPPPGHSEYGETHGDYGGALVAAPYPAATLVPVVERDGEACIIVTKRPEALRHNGGDWVFPGGRVDPGDDGTRHTAAREAAEELGISTGDLEVIGQLDTRGPYVTGFVVDVFVGIVTARAKLDPPAHEVSEHVVVPVAHFLQPGVGFRADAALGLGPNPTAYGSPPGGSESANTTDGRTFRYYSLTSYSTRPDAVLWGAQGDILANFLHALTAGAHLL